MWFCIDSSLSRITPRSRTALARWTTSRETVSPKICWVDATALPEVGLNGARRTWFYGYWHEPLDVEVPDWCIYCWSLSRLMTSSRENTLHGPDDRTNRVCLSPTRVLGLTSSPACASMLTCYSCKLVLLCSMFVDTLLLPCVITIIKTTRLSVTEVSVAWSTHA